MATLRDIEKMTGVSLATISRILNGNKSVSSDKVGKVMAAVEELGYQLPERVSRRQRAHGRMIIAITSNYGFWGEMYDGMVMAAREAGYVVMVHYVPGELGVIDVRRLLSEVLVPELDIAGIIMSNANLDEAGYALLRDRFPVVFCGQYYGLRGAYSVSTNDVEASFELAEHIISTGKRRIALIEMENKYEFENVTTIQDDREQGFLRAARKHDIPDQDMLRCMIGSISEVGSTLDTLLAMENPPDAIFCTHAWIAVEVEIALMARGVDVPGQVALASYDTDFMRGTWPEITTVKQNFREFGIESVNLLESIISGEATRGKKVYIDHSIVVGPTTVGEVHDA